MNNTTPTGQFYATLETAYDWFNQALFKGRLPAVLLTVQRGQSFMGYFSADRWTSGQGQRCHELAINPSYMPHRSLLDAFETLVHEQAHCWQQQFGQPGRRGYHNREWANKMESLGLMPSSTGRPGGRRTGECMSDYPLAHGRFIQACQQLLQERQFTFPWADRYARVSQIQNLDHHIQECLSNMESEQAGQLISPLNQLMPTADIIDITASARVNKNKVKYTCPQCGANVWGRAGLGIICQPCEVCFKENA